MRPHNDSSPHHSQAYSLFQYPTTCAIINMYKCIHLIIIIVILLVHWSTALPEPEPQPNPDPVSTKLMQHSLPPQQNLEGVITSIEERLRALDNLYALRFAAPRWELSVETHNRKLEALEARLARIETVLELKMDKLSESLSSKGIKEELSKDQTTRKIDSIYERLNHRMSYMESRIENNIEKFQNSLDATLTRASSQLEHLEKTGSDMENDILEVGTAVEDSKAMLLALNATSKYVNQTLHAKTLLENISNTTEKVLATCEDSLSHRKVIEEMTRKSMDLVNATRRELQDAIKIVKASANRRHTCPSIPDGTLDDLVERVDGMGRKNEGNYKKLDSTIERLYMRQELYQESCHRLQLKEPQIEDRISEILEKVLDSLENRTYTTDRNYESLLEGLKSHHNYVIRTVGHTTNTVMKLSEQMSHDVKTLYTNHPATEKIDHIISSLQQLQDEFQELNATITTAQQLTPSQSQILLNNTSTILKTIQHLNENMSTIIDRLSDYYRNMADTFEPETDVSSQILQIFNMTEADLASVNKNGGLDTSKDITFVEKVKQEENKNTTYKESASIAHDTIFISTNNTLLNVNNNDKRNSSDRISFQANP